MPTDQAEFRKTKLFSPIPYFLLSICGVSHPAAVLAELSPSNMYRLYVEKMQCFAPVKLAFYTPIFDLFDIYSVLIRQVA